MIHLNFRQKIFAGLLLIYCVGFAKMLTADLPLLFIKDLYGDDESSNSVVSANITRQFFPPMLRVNSISQFVDKGHMGWMQNPYWQHIPPLFAYVPLPFFYLDGAITIEMKRLAYAFVVFLSSICLMGGLYIWSKDFIPVLSAAGACLLWTFAPFTRKLINGAAFGTSDLVLACMVVFSFFGILNYLKSEPAIRLADKRSHALGGFLVSLPILAKHALGAIPAAVYFLVIGTDWIQSKEKRKGIIGGGISVLVFLLSLGIYYGLLYAASPETFKLEFGTVFQHVGEDYEGWARPWHYFLTVYLPEEYLIDGVSHLLTLVPYSLLFILRKDLTKKQMVLLTVPILFYAMNLFAISNVKAKSPNFMFQSYLFFYFAMIYSVLLAGSKLLKPFWEKAASFFEGKNLKAAGVFFLNLCIIIIFSKTVNLVYQANKTFTDLRRKPYEYKSEHEKFYEFAEFTRKAGLNSKDLVFLDHGDFAFQYYLLFLTGAETRLFQVFPSIVKDNPDILLQEIKQKYDRIVLVINKRNEKAVTNSLRIPGAYLAEFQDMQIVFIPPFSLSDLTPMIDSANMILAE